MKFFSKKQHKQVRQPQISDNNESYAFRRSRTMTGSPSNNVRAVGETHATLRSDRLKYHDLATTRKRVVWLLIGCVLSIVIIMGIIGQFIGSVRVAPTYIPEQQRQLYGTAIDAYLRTHPGERFAMTLNADALVRSVQREHPEVKAIAVVSDGFLRPFLATVTLRTPIVVWTLRDQRYFIDEHGVAFTTSPAVTPSLSVIDNTGINPEDAGVIASERMLHFIGRLVSIVQKGGAVVAQIELPANTSRQVNLRLKDKNYPIKTHLDRDPAAQAADVLNAIRYCETHGITPQYLDVRVSSKAYYQ